MDAMRVRSVAASGFGGEGEMIEYGNVRLPARFKAEATGDDLPYRVTLTGVATVEDGAQWEEVVVSRVEGGPPVTSAGVRAVPFGRILRLAVEGFAEEVVRTPTDAAGGRALPLTGGTPLVDEVLHRRRRWLLTDEHLREVAAVYRQGSKLPPAGLPAPTEAVRKHFGVPHPTAARWVATARARGLLEPAGRAKRARKR